MKYIAILMTIVVVVSACGIGYLYLTADVAVTAVGMSATEAQLQQTTFDALKQSLENNSMIGTCYTSDPTLGDASDYQFFVYTLRLRNRSLLTCDMVEIQVTPRDGDVLQMGTEQARALRPGATGDVRATILTSKNSVSARELVITYYVWGIPFSIKTTCG